MMTAKILLIINIVFCYILSFVAFNDMEFKASIIFSIISSLSILAYATLIFLS